MRLRGEISKRSKYWIDRNRYYELKYFCLQYPIWKQAFNSLDGMAKAGGLGVQVSGNADPVEKCVEARYNFWKRMTLVEEAAREADPDLQDYILRGVTEGLGYDILRARYDIPCCKDVYYELYRKFFFILSKKRN